LIHIWRLAPLPAILLGALVATRSSVPVFAFLPNVAGLLIGTGLLAGLDFFKFDFSKWSLQIVIGVLTLLLSTLFVEGLNEVHRWIWLGPLSLNVSVALAPILVWGVRDQLDRSFSRGLLLLFPIVIIHALQPDAGQALVFATGWTAILIVAKDVSNPKRVILSGITILGVTLAFFRVDTLAPVDHVEKIIGMILDQGLPEAIELIFATATLFAPFWLQRTSNANRPNVIVATVYLASSMVVTLVGNFPTPVFGAGLAGVFSWYFLLWFSQNGCGVRPRPASVSLSDSP
jgi:hypothetical protein